MATQTRFTGSFNLNDTPALVRALGCASDNQLQFWFKATKKPALAHQHGLIVTEMADRCAAEYQRRHG
jgi:hypothetical protein